MPNSFRLALVGAGLITQQSHLPAALASPLAEVAAIVDPVVERARQLARAYGIAPHIASRVEEVLDTVDGAVIATPNDSHSALAITCLSAGVSTLIEKPLASSFGQGAAIVEAADKAAKVVAVGYATRFRASVRLLKQLLDDGYFGTVHRFVHQFGTAGGWAPMSGYNLDRAMAGGGVLVVTGTHFLDRMLHFWGYPDDVSLEDDSMGGPEANCTARFVYAHSGHAFEGIARYSKTVQLPAGMVIETDAGYVVLADDDDAEIVFRPRATPGIEQVIRARTAADYNGDVPVFQRQLDNFIAACCGNQAPEVDGRQGLESLRLIEQLYASRRGVDVDPYALIGERSAH